MKSHLSKLLLLAIILSFSFKSNLFANDDLIRTIGMGILQCIAYSPDGGMYTDTTAPAATAVKFSGYVVRPDGAMHIDKVSSGTITLGQRRNANGVWITT